MGATLIPLTQLQGNIGNRAPTYLRDLIGRLSTFSDEPRLAGLVGLVVTMVMDMIYTSTKQPSGVKGKSVGSSSCQVKHQRENLERDHAVNFDRFRFCTWGILSSKIEK